jgi:hypothetical protein
MSWDTDTIHETDSTYGPAWRGEDEITRIVAGLVKDGLVARAATKHARECIARTLAELGYRTRPFHERALPPSVREQVEALWPQYKAWCALEPRSGAAKHAFLVGHGVNPQKFFRALAGAGIKVREYQVTIAEVILVETDRLSAELAAHTPSTSTGAAQWISIAEYAKALPYVELQSLRATLLKMARAGHLESNKTSADKWTGTLSYRRPIANTIDQ